MNNKIYIIGITGGTGSGKTTIVNKVKNLFDQSDVGFLSSDSYFHRIKDIELENLEKLKFSDVKELSSKDKTPLSTDYAYLI